MRIPGYSSTGSKRPDAMFGVAEEVVGRAVRAEGCTVWDEGGRRLLDFTMALGAVALGYGHPRVAAAVADAAQSGGVAGLAPRAEARLADRLAAVLPGAERVRFLKTGAEAVAAAVRISRVATGREAVVTCGYHGWLDWCGEGAGVPGDVRALRTSIPFGDVAALREVLSAHAPAAVVVEPVIDGPPPLAWLEALREETRRVGSVLVFDEIKTAFRLAVGGAAECYGVVPDLIVVGKALGNGMPIAAVAGQADVMAAASRTWISSTLATEWVSLAAAEAVIDVFLDEPIVDTLADRGKELQAVLHGVAAAHPDAMRVRGLPQMCHLEWADDAVGAAVARGLAARGILFKRSAYNFVSAAHTSEDVATLGAALPEAVATVLSC